MSLAYGFFAKSLCDQVWLPIVLPAAATCLAISGCHTACSPISKNVALRQLSASALSTAGVLSGQGPSSKVSTTSLSRRKSYCLKCSKPKPGPPVVSISTMRDSPKPPGWSHAGIPPAPVVAVVGDPAVFWAGRIDAAAGGRDDVGADDAIAGPKSSVTRMGVVCSEDEVGTGAVGKLRRPSLLDATIPSAARPNVTSAAIAATTILITLHLHSG
jgi:hypothetical protein